MSDAPGGAGPFIVRAAPSDAAALAGLAAAALPEPWSEEGFAEELTLPQARIWLARSAGRPVGYLAAHRIVDELLVLSVAVAEAQRRRGTGRALLERAVASEPGVRVVHLEVRSNDAGAQAFYDRLGFRRVGIRGGFYPGGVDAFLLSRRVAGGEAG